MIGRASDKLKRFDLGIMSMKYIIQEIPDCELKIITDLLDIDFLQNLKQKLNLGKHINFIEFTSTPEIYFKNSSLHLFPSISECFPMVLCETKIYGIPNILIGLDYVKMAKGGTIILYDDSPESISRESIYIVKFIYFRLYFLYQLIMVMHIAFYIRLLYKQILILNIIKRLFLFTFKLIVSFEKFFIYL